jgi:hypothetical protein
MKRSSLLLQFKKIKISNGSQCYKTFLTFKTDQEAKQGQGKYLRPSLLRARLYILA